MTTGVKRTRKEIEQIVNDKGYGLLDEYMDKNGVRRVVILDSNGYKYDVVLYSLVVNKIPLFVGVNNRFSLYNISVWLKLEKLKFEMCKENTYIGNKKPLKFYCYTCEDYFYISWDNLSSGHGCGVCAGQQPGEYHSLGYLMPEFIDEWSEKNEMSPFNVTKFSEKKVIWKCKTCNYEWTTLISSRTKKVSECPACSRRGLSPTNNLSIRFPELLIDWDYEKNSEPENYTPHSHKRVSWICSTCKHTWTSTVNNRTSLRRGCPKCRFYKAEKLIAHLLDELKITYIPQHSFYDCRNILPLPFDFYVENINLCTEYYGEQHFFPIDFGGKGKAWAEEEFEKQKLRDKIKKDYCYNNSINLLIIPYWDFNNIESILNKTLKELQH